ncbi:hypothetical protein F5Y15DRAFT_416684 [Xylariaceae sp. FL0016]|nr:hypothetical protein F5Y15DRAFT_416684 [Xylariaceae sp. FL0016]
MQSNLYIGLLAIASVGISLASPISPLSSRQDSYIWFGYSSTDCSGDEVAHYKSHLLPDGVTWYHNPDETVNSVKYGYRNYTVVSWSEPNCTGDSAGSMPEDGGCYGISVQSFGVMPA